MITVSPIKEYHRGFKIEGHAGYAEKGHDIVCASISALVASYTMALKRLSLVEELIDDGYVQIEIINDTDFTDFLVDNLLESLQEIERQYPTHIYVKGDCKHDEIQSIHGSQ